MPPCTPAASRGSHRPRRSRCRRWAMGDGRSAPPTSVSRASSSPGPPLPPSTPPTRPGTDRGSGTSPSTESPTGRTGQATPGELCSRPPRPVRRAPSGAWSSAGAPTTPGARTGVPGRSSERLRPTVAAGPAVVPIPPLARRSSRVRMATEPSVLPILLPRTMSGRLRGPTRRNRPAAPEAHCVREAGHGSDR